MESLVTTLQCIGAAWFIADLVLALLGGFDFIRKVETGGAAKTLVYRTTLFMLYPVILARAAVIAAFEVMKGGAK